jgi:hypothetical protein
MTSLLARERPINIWRLTHRARGHLASFGPFFLDGRQSGAREGTNCPFGCGINQYIIVETAVTDKAHDWPVVGVCIYVCNVPLQHVNRLVLTGLLCDHVTCDPSSTLASAESKNLRDLRAGLVGWRTKKGGIGVLRRENWYCCGLKRGVGALCV